MVHLLWIVPLVLLIAYLASPRFRGDVVESRVRRILAAGLEKNRYTILNDVTLPAGGGTVHIDHLVVSRCGVFVIESQYARGWVAGEEFQDRWRQSRWGHDSRLDNPLHRNAQQVNALVRFLQVPERWLFPMVVMAGQKGFRKPMPERLLTPEKLIAYLRRKDRPILEGEQADRILQQIETARLRSTGMPVVKKWRAIQLLLVILLLSGVYLAFGKDISGLVERLQETRAQKQEPDLFRPDGTRKTDTELWEDSLVCAYSSDSGRCACYERDGPKVEVDPQKCRSLAERGSVLKQ
jgi:hypothetical protein